VLHLPRAAVGKGVVAKRRALAGDAVLERAPDAAVEGLDFAFFEAPRLAQRMHTCPPEGFVGVDVADPGKGPLIKDRRFHRRTPLGEPGAEISCTKRGLEGLTADSLIDVGSHVAGFQQEPRTKPPDVTVGDVRSVV